jgi:hypothetical protein
MALTVIGIAILALGGFWLFGGVVLRVVGTIFVIAGVVNLLTLGNPVALFMVVLGVVMWLGGHWHFALRHHEYKSPLARRIFLQVLPLRYDPTRHWGEPVVSEIPGGKHEDARAGMPSTGRPRIRLLHQTSSSSFACSVCGRPQGFRIASPGVKEPKAERGYQAGTNLSETRSNSDQLRPLEQAKNRPGQPAPENS